MTGRLRKKSTPGILGEPAATIEPRDGALDDPALGEDRESFHMIGAPDDFGFDVGQDARQAVVECRPLIGMHRGQRPCSGLATW